MSTVEAPVESLVESFPEVGYGDFWISTARFRKMIEAGIFGRGDRVFLWRGKLVEKMSKGRPHAFAVMTLVDWLGPLLPAHYHREVEQPLDLEDGTRPEPDLMVIRGPLNDYQVREPVPADLILVVEVADSTLSKNRGSSLRDYARNGIPVFWLVNIPRRRIEVYTQPSGPSETPSYALRVDYEAGTEVSIVLDGQELGRIGVSLVIPGSEV